jgi:hypothetical protein
MTAPQPVPVQPLPLPFPAAESTRVLGLGHIAPLAFAGHDLAPLKTRLLDRVSRNGRDTNALMDLSTVLQLMGHRALGLSMQSLALSMEPLYHLGAAPAEAAVRLLAIVAPGDLAQNNTIELLLEGSNVSLDFLYVAPGVPLPLCVPDHDVAMVAICESDQTRPLLESVAAFLKDWPRPVVCAPAAIARLSRDGASALLRGVPGVVMPQTVRVLRASLDALARGELALEALLPAATYPVIVRPVDSQKGHGLAKLDGPEAIAEYLNRNADPCFYLAPYVEYRSADGGYRKYRILFIDGRPYVCHMAISARWVVHYMNAGMVENPYKRAEEARCFATFDDDFCRHHAAALKEIARRLELEYVGIDCGETAQGELLIFEADSGMTVHAMDPVDLFPYKQPQMRKVFAAFREMLVRRAAR